MITIQELLFNRGLDKKAKIKLVRHKEPGLDLYNRYREDHRTFINYQNSQSQDVFGKVDYIVSFLGEEGTRARFIGVYKILGKKKTKEQRFQYEMNEEPGFEDLKERVIINWGVPSSARAWHQSIKIKKEIIEIQQGLHYKQFTDYLDFTLRYKELKEIINNQYHDWKRVLSIINGIYLISDIRTGMLYVGSAYGKDGIWGRWSTYVRSNGHGGNKTLKKLIEEDEKYSLNFNYSILMLLPRTITPKEVIAKENLFKEKLGKNACLLNNN